MRRTKITHRQYLTEQSRMFFEEVEKWPDYYSKAQIVKTALEIQKAISKADNQKLSFSKST